MGEAIFLDYRANRLMQNLQLSNRAKIAINAIMERNFGDEKHQYIPIIAYFVESSASHETQGPIIMADRIDNVPNEEIFEAGGLQLAVNLTDKRFTEKISSIIWTVGSFFTEIGV